MFLKGCNPVNPYKWTLPLSHWSQSYKYFLSHIKTFLSNFNKFELLNIGFSDVLFSKSDSDFQIIHTRSATFARTFRLDGADI